MAGLYDNHLWRLLLWIVQWFVWSAVVVESSIATTILYVLTAAAIWWTPMLSNLRYRKRQGVILVTGCDSGMGQATVVHLAKTQTPTNRYAHVFAACLHPQASREYFAQHLSLEEQQYVTVVPLDVTQDASVQLVIQTIQAYQKQQQTQKGVPAQDVALTGLCMYHGIAYTGPAEYMPIEIYERQLQVNFLGFVRVIQYLLPLMKEQSQQGRIICTGTGGGSCSPCPPLLTAYMASKFATEAFVGCLRQELYMTGSDIEVLMINPGFVKPTLLMEEGLKLTQAMWQHCERKWGGSKLAKERYGKLVEHFVRYSALQPGTHVSHICQAAEHALLAPVPRSSYKVGVDSKVAPLVGMLPTGPREVIARHGIYGKLSPTGTISGYRV